MLRVQGAKVQGFEGSGSGCECSGLWVFKGFQGSGFPKFRVSKVQVSGFCSGLRVFKVQVFKVQGFQGSGFPRFRVSKVQGSGFRFGAQGSGFMVFKVQGFSNRGFLRCWQTCPLRSERRHGRMASIGSGAQQPVARPQLHLCKKQLKSIKLGIFQKIWFTTLPLLKVLVWKLGLF